MHIERIGADGTPPDPLTPEHLYNALVMAGLYVKGVTDIGAGWARRQAQWPNVFTDEAEDEFTDKFKDPQIKWHQAYFDLADDEALVVEVMPPACEYWMIALHNHWMETLDYVHHQSTLNCHSAQLEPDGSVRFVVAHRDPGVPNWLDTAGHRVERSACAGWGLTSSTCCPRPASWRSGRWADRAFLRRRVRGRCRCPAGAGRRASRDDGGQRRRRSDRSCRPRR